MPIQSEPAPIERSAPQGSYGYGPARHRETIATLTAGQPLVTTRNLATARPFPGIVLRIGHASSVTAVSLDPHRIELKLDRGLINVNVHDPADDTLVLVDLPGGQTQPLKNGLYTFNAATNTARVLKGEALAFPASNQNAKPLKVKEDHAVTFTGTHIKPVEFPPFQARVDLLPLAEYEPGSEGRDYGGGYAPGYPEYPGYAGYGFGLYGDGYGYPYGFGYGYPYGYGYPFGFGLGFGYYGGFGGFRGGYGGFHGRR